MLNEYTLFGDIDKVEIAINRLKEFSNLANKVNSNGYIVLDSGGKDSGVIKMLAHISGVKFEILHNHTTADHPLTVSFIRNEQKYWIGAGINYKIKYPYYKGKRTSMWDMVILKGPPTRIKRWCCDVLKKSGTEKGRVVISGVRWAESIRRKNTRSIYEFPINSKQLKGFNSADEARSVIDVSKLEKGQFFVNPIIDWSNDEVWEFHTVYKLPYNPLYDMGYKRVGCVGCPMGNRKIELENMPKYKKLYIMAFQKFIDKRPDLINKNFWYNGQSIYDWWVNNKRILYYEQMNIENLDIKEAFSDEE